MRQNILLFYITLLNLTLSYSQKIEPKYTFSVELGLPSPIANKPFKDVMQGLVCTSLYGQYSFPFHLNVGLGLRYSYLDVDEFSVPQPIEGGVHIPAAFLKIGRDKFHNDRFATDFGLKFGYAQNYFDTRMKISAESEELKHHLFKNSSVLVEPTLGFILSADEKNSYRLSIGYCFQGYGFNPDMIGITSDENWNPADYSKLTRYLVVGFGYTYYFNKNIKTE